MTLYIGVDIHARQQTVSFLDTGDGTTGQVVLEHEGDDIKGFYGQFEGEVIIGIEACGYTNWFEELMEQLGHQLLVGDAAEIRRLARRRQKNDRRDADLLLDLLVHNEFPSLFRYSKESREVLRQLRYRHKLVKLRTMVVNTLHALAINAGLSLRAQLLTRGGRKQLAGLQLSAISQQQRDELLSLVDELTRRIGTVEQWLQEQAKNDARVQRLQTHPGVGLLTSLCLVHTLGDLSRFSSTRKVAAYVGFDPMEDSSAERKAYGGISKAGSRLLRYLLVEAGQTAARGDEQLKQFYRRLLPRRGKARAKVAVARKLLIRCFIMGRAEIDYAEFLRRGKKETE
ncbi:MAG: IS110 family transposase [Pyrinomonadaceae bacterium]|nr:IS110 family transposase [Pyrinomonadaceae bacterium]